jgi:hypothetical protein
MGGTQADVRLFIDRQGPIRPADAVSKFHHGVRILTACANRLSYSRAHRDLRTTLPSALPDRCSTGETRMPVTRRLVLMRHGRKSTKLVEDFAEQSVPSSGRLAATF